MRECVTNTNTVSRTAKKLRYKVSSTIAAAAGFRYFRLLGIFVHSSQLIQGSQRWNFHSVLQQQKVSLAVGLVDDYFFLAGEHRFNTLQIEPMFGSLRRGPECVLGQREPAGIPARPVGTSHPIGSSVAKQDLGVSTSQGQLLVAVS